MGKVIWLYVAKIVVFAFWSCFLLVPGILSLCNNAFTEMIAFENPNLDTKGVFMLSKELSMGHRPEIFVRLLSALGNALASCVLMFLTLFLIDQFLAVPIFFYLIFVCLTFCVGGLFLMETSLIDVFSKIKTQKLGRANSYLQK